MEHILYIQTGTNLGDRCSNLKLANQWIASEVGPILQESRIYETAAWGIEDQPRFYNQVLKVSSSHGAHEIMACLLIIEKRMGRKRVIKWGERLIDLDILFYDNAIIQSPRLTIPHPEISKRNFVLIPLEEIAGDFLHPILKKSISELVAESEDPLEVWQV